VKQENTAIKFTLPSDILSIGGGFKREYSVEYGIDKTIEKEVAWSVDSRIKVSPTSRALASVNIKEIELEKGFEILATIKGSIMVILYNKANGELYKFLTKNVAEILNHAWLYGWFTNLNDQQLFHFPPSESPEQPVARCSIIGKCKFKLGVEQHVNLEEELIKAAVDEDHSKVEPLKEKVQSFPRKDANNMPILRGR
jgi:hypothetical protein